MKLQGMIYKIFIFFTFQEKLAKPKNKSQIGVV